MKYAITGKGGVGKSTISALLAYQFVQNGHRVLAVDADPDANLGEALGLSSEEQKKVITLSKQKSLIEERTGAKVKEYGQIFKLNPNVHDLAQKYAYNFKGVDLLVLGAIEGGGSGCACPESTFLRSLVQSLVLHEKQVVIMDMEPGVEHLGRATTRGVDGLLVVVEPGQRSINSYKRISTYASQIGLSNILLLANKVRNNEDRNFLINSFPQNEFLAFIPYSQKLQNSDRSGLSPQDKLDNELLTLFHSIYLKLSTKN